MISWQKTGEIFIPERSYKERKQIKEHYSKGAQFCFDFAFLTKLAKEDYLCFL